MEESATERVFANPPSLEWMYMGILSYDESPEFHMIQICQDCEITQFERFLFDQLP
jgi:hypothetical protein